MLTVEVSPATGGTVNIGEETATVYPASFTFATGQVIQVTAIPKQGYSFAGWDGSSTETIPTISITMTCTKNLKAKFTPFKYRVSTTVLHPNMGEVTLDPVQPLDGYVVGTRVYLRATPADGYVFKEWGGAASGVDPVTSIIVDSPKTVNAEFAVKRPLSIGWVWGGTGTGMIAIGVALYLVRFRKR